MTERRILTIFGFMLTIAATCGVPAVRAGEQPFTLARAVPGDAFLCVSWRPNAERQFLDDYWADVIEALKRSGFGDDFMGLIGSLIDAGDMATIEELQQRARELLNNVDWQQLGAGEGAFAERFEGPRTSGDNVWMGPPDMVMMFRVPGDGAEKTFLELATLLKGMSAELNGMMGPRGKLVVERADAGGGQMAKLGFEQQGQKVDLPMTLNVARHQDVVIIAVGDALVGDVMKRLGEKSEGPALADDPRFKAAFSSLPSGEDSAVFFDLNRMLQPFRELAEIAAVEAGKVGDVYNDTDMDAAASQHFDRSNAAYAAGDMQQALEHIRLAHGAAPGCSRVLYNKACFAALAGEKEEALTALDQAVDAGFCAPRKIARDSDLDSLRQDPRYEAALAKARAKAEEFGGEEAKATGTAVRGISNALFDAVGILDHVASVQWTEGHAVHTEELAVLAADARSRRFYPVLAGAQRAGAFDRYLPKETQSFSVSQGIDFVQLHRFLEQTLEEAGPKGQAWLANWRDMQEQNGIDVGRDVVGWMSGNCVSVTLEGGAGAVWLIGVSDEERAREKVSAATTFLAETLTEMSSKQPMLAMLGIRKSPVQHAELEGFENIHFMMSPQPIVWGVADQHLIFGNSAAAVATVLQTAKGGHPNLRDNPRVMSEALLPSGPFDTVSLTDQRGLGVEMASTIGVFSMVSGMMTMAVPPEGRMVVSRISAMLNKLTPVVQRINFYKSSAALSTFDGQRYHTRGVTHFFSPDERPPTPPLPEPAPAPATATTGAAQTPGS